ncbi:MAG: class I SAM-dependent methyltransferase, partial [Nanoarchaeota archaeon]
FIEADVYKLPFSDNQFEVVTSFQMIEHLVEPESAIAEMYRVSKNMVLLTTPIERNLIDPLHLHFFDFYQICDLIEKAVGHNNFVVCRLNKFTKNGTKNIFGIKIFKW